jgi:hypothetical protein
LRKRSKCPKTKSLFYAQIDRGLPIGNLTSQLFGNFSDFNYYELYEEHLTGAKYRQLPYCPVPQKLDTIIGQMIEKGMIQRIKTAYHDKMQTRYIPLAKADLTELKACEKEVIDKVIEQMSDWSASAISRYSHKDMPWLASKEAQ